MANLALTFLHQNWWKEAVKLQVQVTETILKVLKLEHPNTLTNMANLVSTFLHQDLQKETARVESYGDKKKGTKA